MSVCGIDQIAAQVDITLNTNAIDALNAIYRVTSPGVIVHEVSIAFGQTDVIAWIKTGLDSDRSVEHPTMRLARWVNKVRNLRYVRSTVTTILVHDPGHERRHERFLQREGLTSVKSGGRRKRA